VPEGSGKRPQAAAEPAHRPYANGLDQVGQRGRVLRIWQTAALRRSGKKIQFMQFGGSHLRPVVWLHSLEYPMAPPWGLCVDAAAEGYSIIAVRRSGFGESSPAESIEEEAEVLAEFLEEGSIENAVLVVEGTARPAGLKLARSSPRIGFTFLVRPAYSGADAGDLDAWTVNIILQSLQTRAGASLSLAALTQVVRRTGHTALYAKVFKAPSDAEFIQTHRRDLGEAWDCLRRISPETFRRNLGALIPDPALSRSALADFAGLALIGEETLPAWRKAFEARSAELGIATTALPKGSFFVLHQSSAAFLQLLKAHG